MGPAVAFTPQLGPMVKDKNATTGYDLYMTAEGEEDLAELGRLLYVATTRAADCLILAAGVELRDESKEADVESEDKSPFKSSGPWIDLLARQFDLLGGRLRKELPNGYATPSVRVTTTQPAIQSKPVDLRMRRDLLKIVEKAQSMAEEGSGKTSRYLAPVPHDPSARRQYSFSRLTGKLHAQTVAAGPEMFETQTEAEPRLDPRGLGTLVHAVLAEIDFARGDNDVVSLVQRHAMEHLPKAGPDELKEPVELVRRFLASPRAAAMAAAKEVHAELEFLLPWPPDAPQRDGRYLQGFLDCLYRDAEGRWRVVDYKTSKQATPERLAKTAADYEMQMLVYGLAAEQILKCPPVELVLCFLRSGLEFSFAWNGEARQRVLELVNQALP
jgi:ATP-dependent helicase/nuclease subunit A